MPARPLAVVAIAAAVALSLVGCTRTQPAAPQTVTTTITEQPHRDTPAATPTPGTTAGRAVDPSAYAERGGFYFLSPSGQWKCGILPGDGTANAGCHGPFPADVPTVPGSGAPDTMVRPNSVVVGSGPGMARFLSIGDPRYYPGPHTRVLPYGLVLRVGELQCSIDEAKGVTCDNTASHHGFTVSTTAVDLR
ncbi:MAG: hypothetical protein QM728_11295 [Gordonia sp. (in: high G+C Gram-positive bacteria)]|uniref:hypothetical protein n=1 Tax=Gordonia sp. (in: high G+C Gram-positive bacteria) TaxID=84139 RepID=UPI0039E377DD